MRNSKKIIVFLCTISLLSNFIFSKEPNKVKEREYQNLEKDKAEEKAKEVDPEYELLYKKIKA